MAIQFAQQRTLQELAARALGKDPDLGAKAALELARRSPGCKTADRFVTKYVPADEIPRVFDRFVDAWDRAQIDALLDTVPAPEKPVPTVSNINPGGKKL